MNALYNHALKQKNQLTQDLTKFEKDVYTSPISLQGSISATLVAFEKTISQYKQHLNNYKASSGKGGDSHDNTELLKYDSRAASLTQDYQMFSAKFKELKQQYHSSDARKQLFASEDSPFNGDSVVSRRNVMGQSSGSQAQEFSGNENDSLPLYHGLEKEQSAFQRGNAQLEMILEMGYQSLDDIVEQNQILQKMQDKMTRSLTTLGVSQGTISNVNRRLFKDKLIFWIALVLMFLGMYMLVKWLR
ncbi:hypothetical protein ZYGR_0R01000 [Zygosaccharomyces rouxii]|nr:hypothetical protein LQ764DRAFT_210287 [Zygosaccharomyces rouxii]GAV49857.1 hypothetical protein ZYGR_0R01000 [Zygosaccharomyces rouxii]